MKKATAKGAKFDAPEPEPAPTLRDQYAAAALTGLIIAKPDWTMDHLCESAALISDEMMRARRNLVEW